MRVIKLSVVLIMVALLAGCAGFQQIYPIEPPEQNVCTANPEAVLCKIFAYAGVTPGQANDMLLDATLIPVGLKQMKAEEMKAAIDKVITFMDDHQAISFDGLVAWVTKQSDIDPALSLLLSRRLSRFINIPQLGSLAMDTVSREMVYNHLKNQKEQFSWF